MTKLSNPLSPLPMGLFLSFFSIIRFLGLTHTRFLGFRSKKDQNGALGTKSFFELLPNFEAFSDESELCIMKKECSK